MRAFIRVRLFKGDLKYLLIIIVVIFVVFGNSIFFGYINLDEDILVTGNYHFYKSGSALEEMFLNNAYYPSGLTAYYRPVYAMSFAFNTYFNGSTYMFHAMNVVLHALAAVLVFVFIKKIQALVNDQKNSQHTNIHATALSLLFAVHPIVVQTVSWVPARGDSILTVFVLLSFLQLFSFLLTRKIRHLIGHFIFFFLALLSKETAVFTPIIYVLFIFLFGYNIFLKRNYIYLALGWVFAVFFWFFLRQNALNNSGISDISLFKIFGIFWNNFTAILLYLGKILLPIQMSVFPLLKDSSLVFGIISVVVIIFYTAWNSSKLSKLFFFGLAWLFVFLVPAILNYDNPNQMAFFEHRAYLPLVGFLILVVNPISRLNLKNLVIYSSVVVIILALISYNYSLNFKNASVFWRQAVQVSPNSARAHAELANVYVLEKRIEDAEKEYLKAVELDPLGKKVHNNLALLYIKEDLVGKAEEELRKELEIDEYSVVANFNLGNLYARQGELERALPYWIKAVKIDPNHILTHESLAKYYFLRENHEKALFHIDEILKRQYPLNQEMEFILDSI